MSKEHSFLLKVRKDVMPAIDGLTNYLTTIVCLSDDPKENTPIEIIVRPYKKKRSLSANNFYWSSVVEPLAEHLGFSKGQMHEELLCDYYGYDLVIYRGREVKVPKRRTTSPETTDSYDFVGLTQLGQQIAAEQGIIIIEERL
jgi:hypothetical protein